MFQQMTACALCSKAFKTARTLETHIKKYHTHEHPLKCSICAKGLPDDDALGRHMQRHHTSFPCDQCGKTFKQRASLRMHLLSHKQEFGFRCQLCDKGFKNPKSLSAHKRAHQTLRAFVCEFCGYQTQYRWNLQVHRRTHLSKQLFCCDHCGKCFPSLSQLAVHKRLHGSRERAHQCDVCLVAFFCSRALYHHKKLHLETKHYLCNLCGSTYAQAAGMSQHRRWHREQYKCATAISHLQSVELELQTDEAQNKYLV